MENSLYSKKSLVFLHIHETIPSLLILFAIIVIIIVFHNVHYAILIQSSISSFIVVLGNYMKCAINKASSYSSFSRDVQAFSLMCYMHIFRHPTSSFALHIFFDWCTGQTTTIPSSEKSHCTFSWVDFKYGKMCVYACVWDAKDGK